MLNNKKLSKNVLKIKKNLLRFAITICNAQETYNTIHKQRQKIFVLLCMCIYYYVFIFSIDASAINMQLV